MNSGSAQSNTDTEAVLPSGTRDLGWLGDINRMRDLFKLVWEGSLDGMRLADASGIMVDVNEAFCKLVGYTREELIGQPFHTPYIYDDPRTKLREFRERFASRIIPRHFELQVILRRDGQPRNFQLSSSFLEAGKEVFLLTIYRDVTERKKNELERERLTAALAQRASQLADLTLSLAEAEQQERRRIARRMHDDIQQYLVAAKVRLSRARARDREGPGFEEDLNVVGEILRESVEATRSLATELSPPGLRDEGLVDALHLLAETLRKRNRMTVRIIANGDVEPACQNLRGLVFDAIRELLFNVFKHACVNDADVLLSRRGDDLQIEVTDRGIGFNPAKLWSSLDPGVTRLGLIGLDTRISHLRGKLTVRSAPEKGTTVTLSVPIRDGRPETATEPLVRKRPAEPGPGSLSGDGTVKVLIVDDHKLLRDGLKELLREEKGMEVVGEAENGLKGIEAAMRLQPDIVLMDITMPEMNGIDATRLLRERFPAIAIVGLSMHEADMASEMMAAGATAYVSKTAATDILTKTMWECLRSRRATA